MNFNEIPYQCPDKENVIKEFENLRDEIVQQALSQEALEAWFKRFNLAQNQLNEAYYLATLRYSMDIGSEYAEELSRLEDIFQEVNPLIQELYCLIKEIKQMMAMQPKIYGERVENLVKTNRSSTPELNKKESQLIRQYQELVARAELEFNQKTYTLSQMNQFLEDSDREVRCQASQTIESYYEAHQDQLIEIYTQLTEIRRQQAERLGYDNYAEYSFDALDRIGYTPEHLSQFRQAVEKYIVPLGKQLVELQQSDLNIDKVRYYDLKYKFNSGTPKFKENTSIVKATQQMFESLFNEPVNFVEMMREDKLFDLEARKNKLSGAFSEYLPIQEIPFVFTNFYGSHLDLKIFLHELGHAFQVYHSREVDNPLLTWPTSEACEIHSITMELMSWPFLGLYFDDKDVIKYQFDYLIESIYLICYSCLIDHFQHDVAIEQLKGQEINQRWRELELRYTPWKDYQDNPFYQKGTFWLQQHHIFTVPFYYIEYAIAQVCAFMVWQKYILPDSHRSIQLVQKLYHNAGAYFFIELLERLEVSSPFQEGVIEQLSQTLKEVIEATHNSLNLNSEI